MYDIDLEAHHVTHPKGGVIVKQTSVEVIETRKSEEDGPGNDVGDYYLVKQAQRECELLARKSSGGRGRRSSTTFGIGKSV